MSDDVLAMLGEMTAEGNVLKRLQRDITRQEYLTLNKVLEALGGKWQGGRVQGHVFPSDPRPMIEAVLTTGEYVDPRANDMFETPDEIAETLVTMAEVRSGHRVLEPSAGRGRIVEQLRRCGAVVTCVELLPGNVKELRERGFQRLIEGDFLVTDLRALSFLPEPEPRFDRIAMNPPFSGQADIDHVLHAFGMLAPGGVLVAVMSAGTNFRTNRKAEAFRAFVTEQGGSFVDLPAGAFKESGTNVRTVIVSLRREPATLELRSKLADSRPSCFNCHGVCGTGSRNRYGQWWCPSCLPAAPRAPEKRDCACGCGAKVSPPSRFRPDHDARLKAVVLRVVRGKADPSEVPADGVTREYLMLAPWVTKEMAQRIGL